MRTKVTVWEVLSFPGRYSGFFLCCEVSPVDVVGRAYQPRVTFLAWKE
jgi:hypothetical protein